MRRRLPPLFALALSACASGAAGSAGHTAPAPKPAPPAAAPAPAPEAAPIAAAAPAPAPEPVVLPDTVDGADIPRPVLLLILEQGVGRFLQKVSIEPHLERGRFVGWRLLELFEHDPELSRGVLLPGDTLLRVNGQSVERPEQLKNVWDSLATESQLVLQVMRAGKTSEIRHRIVQSAPALARNDGAGMKAAKAAAAPATPAASPAPPAR